MTNIQNRRGDRAIAVDHLLSDEARTIIDRRGWSVQLAADEWLIPDLNEKLDGSISWYLSDLLKIAASAEHDELVRFIASLPQERQS